MQNILQRSGELLVLLPRAFGWPFRVLAGTEELFVFMPTGQQTVNVPGRVLQPVLVEHSGLPGQAHTGKPIVLGDDNISRLHPVDQGKVHAVSSLVKDQRLSILPLDAMGRITEDSHRYAMDPANSHRQVHHRAAVCVNQNRWHPDFLSAAVDRRLFVCIVAVLCSSFPCFSKKGAVNLNKIHFFPETGRYESY